MSRSKIAALRLLRAATVDKQAAVMSRSQGGALSENEREAYEPLNRDLKDFQERIMRGEHELAEEEKDYAQRDPLAAAAHRSHSELVGVGFRRERRRRASLTLGREERMVERAAERDERYSVEDSEEFNFGAAIRGMVRGDWREADFERRALGRGRRRHRRRVGARGAGRQHHRPAAQRRAGRRRRCAGRSSSSAA